MMKRLALAFGVAAGLLTMGQPAQCVYCPVFVCYGGGCGTDCVCMESQPGKGRCVSFEWAPVLEREGWERVR